MKKIILILSILFFVSLAVNAQSTFYYYGYSYHSTNSRGITMNYISEIRSIELEKYSSNASNNLSEDFKKYVGSKYYNGNTNNLSTSTGAIRNTYEEVLRLKDKLITDLKNHNQDFQIVSYKWYY